MKRVRVIWACLATVALCALAIVPAGQAAEYGRCVHKAHSEYVNENCTSESSEAQSGEFEWEAAPTTFSGTTGKTESKSELGTIACSSGTTTGKLTSSKRGVAETTYVGCEGGGEKCTSLGASHEGELKTLQLEMSLIEHGEKGPGGLEPKTEEVWLELANRHGAEAPWDFKFTCPSPFFFEVDGSLAAPVVPVDRMSASVTELFREGSGEQELKTSGPCNSEFGECKYSNLSSTVSLEGSLTSTEPFEIRLRPPSAPKVHTGSASEVTGSSAMLHATVNPDYETVSECTFEYGTTPTYGENAPCEPLPGSGGRREAVSAPLEDLAAGTTYHFRISARNATGTADGADETFKTLNVPVINDVTPAEGVEAGGTAVTVEGSGFGGATAVRFGATPAKSFKVESPDVLTAVAPAGEGTVDVRVVTPEGTTEIVPADEFSYLSPEQQEEAEAEVEAEEGLPTVTGVSPDAELARGGEVELTGANYGKAGEPDEVKKVLFGEEEAVSFTVHSSTKITAVAPEVPEEEEEDSELSATVGQPLVKARKEPKVKARVVTAVGESVQRTDNTLTYVAQGMAPSVSKVLPDKGPSGSGTRVELTGANLVGVRAVYFGSNPATQIEEVSEGAVSLVAPQGGEGTVAVKVLTPNGESAASSKSRFKYGKPATPSVSYVSPREGALAGGSLVTVGGEDFVEGMSFTFGKAAPVKALSCVRTSCKVRSPAGKKAGSVDVIAVNGKAKSKKNVADEFKYE